MVTDPPYNVSYEGGTGLTIENDRLPEADFLEFLKAAFANMKDSLKPGGAFYIFHADLAGSPFRVACEERLGKVRQVLIWNKSGFVMGRQDYQWKHEPCLYGWTDGAAHYFVDDRSQSTVIEDKGIDLGKLKKEEMRAMLKDILGGRVSTTVITEDKPTANDIHPTMKPLKLLARLIKNSSRQGEAVLDTFGGSGSTLMACEQLNRVCYTMELDPKYASAILRRYVQAGGDPSEVWCEREGERVSYADVAREVERKGRR